MSWRMSRSLRKPSDSASSRIAIPHPHGNATIWCDVDVFSTERGAIHYATDVTNAVHAEAAQREFVQTLTKTFANLTTRPGNL